MVSIGTSLKVSLSSSLSSSRSSLLVGLRLLKIALIEPYNAGPGQHPSAAAICL